MEMFRQYAKSLWGDKADDLARQAQFVDITNVAQWFYEDNERDQYDIAGDFPTLALPWPLVWMEYRWPRNMRIGSKVHELGALAGKHSGVLILSMPLKDGKDALEQDAMYEFAKLQLAAKGRSPTNPFLQLDQEMHDRRDRLNAMIERAEFPKWLVSLTVLQESRKKVEFVGVKYLYLNEYGQASPDSIMNLTHPALGSLQDMGVTPFAFAISLLHCKNVHIEDVPPVPPQIQKKREKHGIPTITFKTLIVEPMRQQVRREVADDPTGEQNQIKRALHIARGHFKDYRDGPGLFGKYKGLYWWDMHVRGSADSGVVVKDYKIQPPNDAPA